MTATPCNRENENRNLHLSYWLLISILVLIAVANEKWSSQPKFTEFLSNAATMTSLMLGLVAILYSFVANNGLSQSLGNISVVSNDVRESKDQIAEYLNKTKQVADASEEHRKALQSISSTVSENLGSLRAALDVVATQTGLLPGRMEQLENTVSEATKAIGAKPVAPAPVTPTQDRFWTDAAVSRFCERQPLTGNLLAYACVIANERGQELSIAEFAKAIESKIPNYLQGVLMTMHSCQLVTRMIVKGKPNVYNITSVDEQLSKIARTYYETYVKNTYDEQEQKSWMDKLTAVEDLFI